MKLTQLLILSLSLIMALTGCKDDSPQPEQEVLPIQSQPEEQDPSQDFLANVPECNDNTDYFTHPHMPVDAISVLMPMGQVGGPGHNFPTDHMYFYSGMGDDYTIKAPGKIYIKNISSTQHSENYTDYSINFYSCKNLSSSFGHITELNAQLQALVEQPENCETYTVGLTTKTSCEASVDITLEAGDIIGQQTGGYTLDVGSRDDRIDPYELGFINPEKNQNSSYGQMVCPIALYTDSLRSMYETKINRDDTPLCGKLNYDLAGTAQGLWYVQGSAAQVQEDEHLSLTYHANYSTHPVIGAGMSFQNTASGVGPFELTSPLSSGLINRPFSEITNDGQTYCYEGLQNANNIIFLLKMNSDSTLMIESVSTMNCSDVAWNFSASALYFER